MSQILIRVGATRDRSLDEVFDAMVSKAKRARSQVAAEAKASAAEQSTTWKAAQRELARMERERVAEIKKSAADRTKAEKDAAREEEREAKKAAKAKIDAEREAQREVEKEQKKAERAHAAHMKKLTRDAEQGAKDRAKAFGAAFSGAARLGGQALRFGASVAGDLARATGVRTDLGSIMAANADLETAATNLSNSSYMAGDKRNGKRVDPADIEKFAFEQGSATGFGANDVVGALAQFVSKTGDLKTGMESFQKMAQLARATGSDITDMADAMGDVSNNLGDIPDKANVLNQVMRQIAGQGKLGAVEIKDLATQMAKVASAAGQIEGNAAANIGLMGAFAQESRQRGGSSSATQAATAVSAMLANFKQPTAVKEFKARGINVFNENGQIRDPKAILLEALKKAGNDPVAMKAMYRTAQADRAVAGFASVYRDAYAAQGGTKEEKTAAGIAAVNAEFDRLQKATLAEQEVMDSFNKSMSTGQAQANVFNNEMQAATLKMQKELTPALIALTPTIIKATKAFADVMVKLLGDNGSKQAQTEEAAAATSADLTATKKQMESGTVFQEQIDKNKTDAKVLQERINAQKADALERQSQSTSDQKLIGVVGGISEELGSDDGFWSKAAKIGSGYSAAQGMKKYRKLQGDNAAADTADADMQQRKLDELIKAQKEMTHEVKNGTLKVQVVNAKTAGGPAAPPPTGTQVEGP